MGLDILRRNPLAGKVPLPAKTPAVRVYPERVHIQLDSRIAIVDVPVQDAFVPIRQIGGERGWYFANTLWRLRGFLDLLVGGVGIRRGRRHPDQLRVGDPLDFWRVEEFDPSRRLRLQAEMKVPGRAWLEFEVSEVDGGSQIRQTALFEAVGLFGLAYWYALYPLHHLVFEGMLRNVAKRANRTAMS